MMTRYITPWIVTATGITNNMQVCYAVAEQLIAERKLSFDDLERETGRRDTSRWGTDASRRKRSSILAEFKRLVMADASILDKYELR